MRIHIPNSAWIGNIDPFLRSFDLRNPDVLEITSHDKWVYVHPVVLSMIVSLGLSVKNAGGRIEYNRMTAISKHYFERMKVFELLGLDSEMDITEHESSGRFVPVKKITNSKDLNAFMTEMIPLLHKNREDTEAIKYVISELVRNVLEHSEDHNGAIVCAQYYKKSDTIRIGVADSGIGIRRSISQHHTVQDDLHALQLALTPGITGTTSKIGGGGTEQNAGAGLFFIKSIATVNRDFFILYSGSAAYKLLRLPKGAKIKLEPDPSKDKHSPLKNIPYWKGTAVGIDLCLKSTQDFDVLLKLIRKTYSTGRKDEIKKKYKKARFI